MNVDLLPIPLLRTGKVQVRDFTLDEMLAYARANVAADRAQRQAEPAVYKVGCLLTVNDDPYPALPGLFGQLWDGDVVAARVYGNSREEVNERVAALNVAVPELAAKDAEIAALKDQLANRARQVELDTAMMASATRRRVSKEAEIAALRLDAEALRLAVKLNIFNTRGRGYEWPVHDLFISHGDDPFAATRRAIERAAEAIAQAVQPTNESTK